MTTSFPELKNSALPLANCFWMGGSRNGASSPRVKSKLDPFSNGSVTGGQPLRIKVGRKGKVVPWPGSPGGPLGTMRR